MSKEYIDEEMVKRIEKIAQNPIKLKNQIELPKLYSYVYVITYVDDKPYCIVKDMIYMKNDKEFITEAMMSDSVIEEYRRPLDVSEYGDRWAHTLKEAKEIVKKYAEEHDLDYDIIKAMGDAWNVELWEKRTE